ncbi:DegT/DnrJ/EryC1/StrS family aminotransferase [Candidatus Dojkabacteria bacterium]|uniref:DegT/DnrJ/EryC1/StrS family aminotransferase n=1 Tax=Candidatus Dojkabacteria bacterium TaxID=2099670 RepID=A0A955L410_9BACT|nr:DegT/DnrJ/EryC1/StrS family aminotransferase [Candidatus Dojkabacteria bacterium]
MKINKTMFTAHSPNTERDDLTHSLKSIFKFGNYKEGKELDLLQTKLESYFSSKVFLLDSARSALFIALKAMGIGEDDEVIIQAFNCVAVPNSIIWAGAKPVYSDIGPDLNIDFDSLRTKINEKTKAIVVQHTFGYPVDVDAIRNLIGDRKIYIIEDCAQMIGSKIDGRLIGTVGDMSIVSFGRDKAFSSGFGGALVVNKTDLVEKVEDLFDKLEYLPTLWSIREAKYPLLMSMFVKPFFNFFNIGKVMLIILQKIHFITNATTHEEKVSAGKPDFMPSKLNNILASAALFQFSKFDRFQSHRTELTSFYHESLKDTKGIRLPDYNWSLDFTLLRFPILVKDPMKAFKYLNKEYAIILGDWYRHPVSPKGVNMEVVNYHKGDCPNAEGYCAEILNLPLNINVTMNDAERIIRLLKNYLSKETN